MFGANVRVANVQPVLKVVAMVVLLAGALTALPAAAQAQDRGTLQATARVVNTAPGFDALLTTQAAVRNGRPSDDTVSTLASVSVTEPRQGVSGSIIVTVAFAKN